MVCIGVFYFRISERRSCRCIQRPAQQSRAEPSGAEPSRAEQSQKNRACWNTAVMGSVLAWDESSARTLQPRSFWLCSRR